MTLYNETFPGCQSPQQTMSADCQSAFLFIKLFSLMEARNTKAGIVPHFYQFGPFIISPITEKM